MPWTDPNRLHELVEKLQDQVDEPATRSAILITLNELNTYAARLFEQEERYFANMRSAELKSRQTLHKRLLQQLADHTEDFKEEPTPKVREAFFSFLNAWVQLHNQTVKTMPEGWDAN